MKHGGQKQSALSTCTTAPQKGFGALSSQILYVLLGVALALPATAALAETMARDVRGVDVALPAPARRVVSLAPHLTELVFAAGAGDLLVGTVSYSDYPAAAEAIPRVGSFDTVNYESLLALKPDLVIAWLSGNGEQTVARLETLGFTVFAEETKDLEAVATSLRNLGVLTGRREVAEQAAQGYLKRLDELRARFGSQDKIGVYYQIWDEPLLTLNDKHVISDVVRLCGGYNVFGEAIPLVSRISVESVILANPDVILASGVDKTRPDWLDNWRQWTSIKAVQHEQLYFVAPDILQRHTPRIIQGAQQVCEHLSTARDYYRRLEQ